MTDNYRYASEIGVGTWALGYFINREELKHCLLNHSNKIKQKKNENARIPVKHATITISEICLRINQKSKASTIRNITKICKTLQEVPRIWKQAEHIGCCAYTSVVCVQSLSVCRPASILGVYQCCLCGVGLPLSYECTSVVWVS